MSSEPEMEVVKVSTDDHQFELRVFRQVTNTLTNSSTIVCAPAMGVAARKYDTLALALSAHGFNVVIAELRGIGSSSVRASRAEDYGYHEMANIDLPAIHRQVETLFTGDNIYLLGHSLGGQMISLYLGQNPDAADGLILCASCTVYYRNWAFPGNLGLLAFTQFGGLLATLMGYFPGKKIGFGGQEARSVMQDWAYNARSGRYRSRQQGVDLETGLKQVGGPVLTINFADDTFAPEAGTDHLVGKFSPAASSARRRVRLNAEHLGVRKADHFAWLKQPEEVALNVSNWVRSLAE
ncbi:MAG: alpha/beta fold hydrolase [Pseudomonadota bacterium]